VINCILGIKLGKAIGVGRIKCVEPHGDAFLGSHGYSPAFVALSLTRRILTGLLVVTVS
jgi:hypothetical protein